ncbi:MAG: ATP-dependent 6-phosphofructokinase [Gammaproteobacteria bacterium]|nr:ATP-dependent 6-phosphofructokinase [Gammaproteobacteria bacterium]
MPDTDSFAIEQLGPCKLNNPLTEKQYFRFREDDEKIPLNPVYRNTPSEGSMELAGARRKIYFQPGRTRAAIVTCGGLCPGINAVIRGIVMQLWHIYGCKDIIGIRYGFGGLTENAPPPIELNPTIVNDLKTRGGTILGTSRGTPPTDQLVDSLEWKNIDILFVIGGDGSMRGANAIWEEVKKRGLKKSIIGVPKTIDNDIPFVTRSFGFETAVAEACEAVNCASTEARGIRNGIGIVKLMGRNAGYIAANACLASGNANFCLIPEVAFALDGPGGFLDLLERRLRLRHNAVIVIAEGAGQEFFADQDLGSDASGNRKLGDIGLLLKERISTYLKKVGLDNSIKYIEPSYLIRSTGPNANDQLFCDTCARAAVHAALAGKSGLLIGNRFRHIVHVPMRALAGKERKVNPDGDLWFSVRENTGQPQYIGTQASSEQAEES